LKFALEGIQYFVEDLDLANDLHKVDGLTTVVNLLSHENAEIRYWSSWIIASTTHNHPKTQATMVNQFNVIQVLCDAIKNESNDNAKDKQLYALSAITSGNQTLQDQFVDQYNGIPLLVSLTLSNLSNTQWKSVWFLIKLFTGRPSNTVLARNTNFVKNLIKVLEGTTREDLTVKVIEVLSLFVKDDDNNLNHCKLLGLDKVLIHVLKNIKEEEEQQTCKQLLNLLTKE